MKYNKISISYYEAFGGIIMLKKTTAKLSAVLIGNNLIGSVLVMLLILPLIAYFPAGFMQTLFTIISVLILWSLLYTVSWREATKDLNRVKFGHMKKATYKGLIAGLFASLPLLIIYVIYICNIHSAPAYIVYLVFYVPYSAFVAHFKSNAAALALLLIPMPIVAHIGYQMGQREWSILEKLVYKKRKKAN